MFNMALGLRTSWWSQTKSTNSVAVSARKQLIKPSTFRYLSRNRRSGLQTVAFRGESQDSQDAILASAASENRMSVSLFTKINDLPPPGKTLGPEDEYCDTYASICRTPIHVWEAKCPACGGSGTTNITSGGRRGRRHLSVCLKCEGVGVVRHISSAQPHDEASEFTIARPDISDVGPYCHRPQIPKKDSPGKP